MIFNKKNVMLLAICLLITNKQYLAAEPGNEASNILERSLVFDNVVQKQLDEEKARADLRKRLKFLKDEEDKKYQHEADKKAQDEAFNRLTELDKKNIILCNDAIKYVLLFRKYICSKRFEVFRKGYEDFESKVWNFSENAGRNYDRVKGEIIDCKPKR